MATRLAVVLLTLSVALQMLSGNLEILSLILHILLKLPQMGFKYWHPRCIEGQQGHLEESLLLSTWAIIKRLFTTSPNDFSHPQPMRFHKWWPHPDCPVVQWYDQQANSGLSTRFKIIEHRRQRQAPFNHEYLIIHLEDGAVCRLERVGEGSRADALRRVGCKAHDIIQRFTRNTYNNDMLFNEPSDLVIRVDFPRAFDLFDVLAICFSIQTIKRSSAYTLQRYNCYFLCLTVLTVLTRRVAEWRAGKGKEIWSKIVEDSVRQLETAECNDAYDYLGFGICNFLNPENKNPRKCIIDSLRHELGDNGLSSLNHAFDDTLWYSDLELAPHRGLSTAVESAAKTALESTSTWSMRMKRLLSNENRDELAKLQWIYANMPSDFHKTLSTGFIDMVMKSWKSSAKSATATYAMRQVEDSAPFAYHFLAACIAGIQIIRDFVLLQGSQDPGQFGKMTLLSRMQLAVRLFPLFLALKRIEISKKLSWEEPEDEDIEEFSRQSGIHASIIATYNIIESILGVTHHASLVTLGLLLGQQDWICCLRVCVGRTIRGAVGAVCLPLGQIIVRTPMTPTAYQMSVVEFQEFVTQRIQAHSERVACIGLAPATLVQDEITMTMTKVWKNVVYKSSEPDGQPKGSTGRHGLEQVGWERWAEDFCLNNLFLLDN